jgi:hypothetical protein
MITVVSSFPDLTQAVASQEKGNHAMTKLYPVSAMVLLVQLLAGCLGIPDQPVKMPDYSLGPVSSVEFPDLLNDAIPVNEGEVHVFGKVHWTGFRDNRNYPAVPRYIRAVAAITDTDILLLQWYEPEKRYEVVKRLPFTEILYVSKLGSAAIYLYFADRELSLGGTNYVIFGDTPFKTFLQFTKPSGFSVDQEKTEAAFLILKENIELYEKPRPVTDTSFDDDH